MNSYWYCTPCGLLLGKKDHQFTKLASQRGSFSNGGVWGYGGQKARVEEEREKDGRLTWAFTCPLAGTAQGCIGFPPEGTVSASAGEEERYHNRDRMKEWAEETRSIVLGEYSSTAGYMRHIKEIAYLSSWEDASRTSISDPTHDYPLTEEEKEVAAERECERLRLLEEEKKARFGGRIPHQAFRIASVEEAEWVQHLEDSGLGGFVLGDKIEKRAFCAWCSGTVDFWRK